MKVYTFQEADLNAAMTSSMVATLNSLVSEEIISEEKAVEYMNTHVCLMVNNNTVWYRLKKFLKWSTTDTDAYWPVVFKISAVKEN